MSKNQEVKSSAVMTAEADETEKASAPAKAAEDEAPEVKSETKKEVVKEVASETAPVKEASQRSVKKPAAKTKKPVAKTIKEKPQPEVFLQFSGNEVDIASIIDRAKQIYISEGHRESSIKTIKVYIKPEEYAAYYVINNKINGQVNLF